MSISSSRKNRMSWLSHQLVLLKKKKLIRNISGSVSFLYKKLANILCFMMKWYAHQITRGWNEYLCWSSVHQIYGELKPSPKQYSNSHTLLLTFGLKSVGPKTYTFSSLISLKGVLAFSLGIFFAVLSFVILVHDRSPNKDLNMAERYCLKWMKYHTIILDENE